MLARVVPPSDDISQVKVCPSGLDINLDVYKYKCYFHGLRLNIINDTKHDIEIH